MRTTYKSNRQSFREGRFLLQDCPLRARKRPGKSCRVVVKRFFISIRNHTGIIVRMMTAAVAHDDDDDDDACACACEV